MAPIPGPSNVACVSLGATTQTSSQRGYLVAIDPAKRALRQMPDVTMEYRDGVHCIACGVVVMDYRANV